MLAMPVTIKNDLGLLDDMMSGLAAYDGILGPGPYWVENKRDTLKWLRSNDLNDFRTYDPFDKALSNFGGGSRWPRGEVIETQCSQLFNSPVYRLAQKIGITPVRRHYQARLRELGRGLALQKLVATLMARLVAELDVEREISRFEFSGAGNPSDAIEIDGKFYSPKFLDEFLKYLDMKTWIDFSTVRKMVEIGPGSGAFAELMAKLDPARQIYLIDIPPQLYVTEQVLSAVFPGEVAGFRTIRDNPGVLGSKDFRLFIMAPWQSETADISRIDLAFNQVSFSEMHIDTVEAYINLLMRWKTHIIAFRAANLRKREDGPGADDYIRFLSQYDLFAREQIGVRDNGNSDSASHVAKRDRSSSAFYFRARGGIG